MLALEKKRESRAVWLPALDREALRAGVLLPLIYLRAKTSWPFCFPSNITAMRTYDHELLHKFYPWDVTVPYLFVIQPNSSVPEVSLFSLSHNNRLLFIDNPPSLNPLSSHFNVPLPPPSSKVQYTPKLFQHISFQLPRLLRPHLSASTAFSTTNFCSLNLPLKPHSGISKDCTSSRGCMGFLLTLVWFDI